MLSMPNGISITSANFGSFTKNIIDANIADVIYDNGVKISLGGSSLSIADVTASAAGSDLSIHLPAGIAFSAGDYIIVSGIRVDVSSMSTMDYLDATLSSNPMNAYTFYPTPVHVGLVQAPTVTTINAGNVSLCGAPTITAPSVIIGESYAGEFVQYIYDPGPAPDSRRLLYGANANMRFHLVVSSMPAGVTLSWPQTVAGSLVNSSNPDQIINSLEKVAGSPAGDDVIYEYRSLDPSVSDTRTESFTISPSILVGAGGALAGTATLTGELLPGPDSGLIPRFVTFPGLIDSPVEFLTVGCLVDNKPPDLTIDSPFDGDTVRGYALKISGTATDNSTGGSGISAVLVNGERADNDTATGGDAAFWIKVVILKPGENIISVLAKDNSPAQNQTIQTITVTFEPLKSGADLNSDDRPDILWHNSRTGEVQIWLMDGANLVQTVNLPDIMNSNWVLVGSGDMDGDGQNDLVWHNKRTGNNLVWLMNGTEKIGTQVLPAESDLFWQMIGVGDYNGDSIPDLLWRNVRTGENRVWIMAGLDRLSDLPLPKAKNPYWILIGFGDFTGDGQPDLIWQNRINTQMEIWKKEDKQFVKVSMMSIPGNFGSLLAGIFDFDGDGKLDLFWHNEYSRRNTICLMDGTRLNSLIALPVQPNVAWKTGPDY